MLVKNVSRGTSLGITRLDGRCNVVLDESYRHSHRLLYKIIN